MLHALWERMCPISVTEGHLLAAVEACNQASQSLDARTSVFGSASEVSQRGSVCWLAIFPALPPLGVMSPSHGRVTLHVAWPASGLGGAVGPFFLYSHYLVLVTVYVILDRDPRRWSLK